MRLSVRIWACSGKRLSQIANARLRIVRSTLPWIVLLRVQRTYPSTSTLEGIALFIPQRVHRVSQSSLYRLCTNHHYDQPNHDEGPY